LVTTKLYVMVWPVCTKDGGTVPASDRSY
jgi:hypothetical protein